MLLAFWAVWTIASCVGRINTYQWYFKDCVDTIYYLLHLKLRDSSSCNMLKAATSEKTNRCIICCTETLISVLRPAWRRLLLQRVPSLEVGPTQELCYYQWAGCVEEIEDCLVEELYEKRLRWRLCIEDWMVRCVWKLCVDQLVYEPVCWVFMWISVSCDIVWPCFMRKFICCIYWVYMLLNMKTDNFL